MVSGYRSTTKSNDMFNATVDYFHPHFYMHTIRREDVSTCEVIWGTGERGGGDWRPTNYDIKTFAARIIGELNIFLKPTMYPLPPPDFQVVPEAQSGSKTSSVGSPGHTEPGAARQALSGARQRRAGSEGSLWLSEGSLQPKKQAETVPSRAWELAREGEIKGARE